jgi:hypothetical protein
MILGQAKIRFEEFINQFKPTYWINPARAQARATRRDVHLIDKLDNRIKNIEGRISTAAESLLIDDVRQNFEALCKTFETEFFLEEKGIRDLLKTCDTEFNKFEKMFAKSKNQTSQEFKNLVLLELVEFRKISSEWFKKSERIQNFSIQMSDKKAIEREIEHILDPFNYQMVAKQIKRSENKLLSVDKKMARKNKPLKLAKEETVLLNGLKEKIKNSLNLLDKAYNDSLLLIQLSLNEEQKALNEVIFYLGKAGYPEHELESLQKTYKSLNYGFIQKELKQVVEDSNGLVRQFMSVRQP